MLERTGVAARAADADDLSLRDHAILELLYAGGLRVGEICSLRVEDFRAAMQQVQVRGKGDKERIVPLGRKACAAIEAYLERGRPGLVRRASGMQRAMFLSVRGNALTRQWVWEMVRSTSMRKSRVRISCGIAARLTWWSMGPTCVRCRRFWGTRILRLRRCTRMWRWGG